MPRAPFKFAVKAECPGTSARVGEMHFGHGVTETPLFMPVATQAAVKAQTFESLHESGAKILLANAYHLMLRPGEEVLRKMGGIHKFMNWSGGVLTDSGGFQIFSLPHARRVAEDGAVFSSYVDGTKILLTPERSIGAQGAIGSDIMMVLDECVPGDADFETSRRAMELTHRWAKRSLAERARLELDSALFGIVQGACHESLRRESAAILTEMPFDGLAIGGLAVGESRAAREDMTELAASLLPRDRPRYLMGVGTPLDLLEAIHRGVDLFDCIIPTAWAQRGGAFRWDGKLQLRRSAYRVDSSPIDETCTCHACRKYSRAYLHHLIKADEVLGWQLIGEHNLEFYRKLTHLARAEIRAGTFPGFYRAHRDNLSRSDAPETKKAAPPPTRRGEYEVVEVPKTELKLSTILHIPSGERMHSTRVPSEEAKSLYVDQPGLVQRLREPGEPLVVWDVGLGMAQNACVVLDAAEGATRKLELVSFENDLDALRLALAQGNGFPYLRKYSGAVRPLAKNGAWKSPNGLVFWRLLSGDFLEMLERAMRPDVILYDPFSARTNPGLWSSSAFARLRAKCGDGESELYTYSQSGVVREALATSGFIVARGSPTGPKEETTIALTSRALERRTQGGTPGLVVQVPGLPEKAAEPSHG